MGPIYYATSALIASYTHTEGYKVKDFQTDKWNKCDDPLIGRTIAREGTPIPLSQVDRVYSILKTLLCPLPPSKELMKYVPPMRSLIVKSIKPRL